MRKAILLTGSALLVTSLLYAPLAKANIGDDNFVTLAGVPGAPQGGMTGTSGNAGAGDHDAGTDRAQSYYSPINSTAPDPASSSNSAGSTTSSMSNTTTTDDQSRRHQHRRDSNGMNETTSSTTGRSGNSGAGTPPNGDAY